MMFDFYYAKEKCFASLKVSPNVTTKWFGIEKEISSFWREIEKNQISDEHETFLWTRHELYDRKNFLVPFNDLICFHVFDIKAFVMTRTDSEDEMFP